jgi:hypothetical protein
MVMRERRADTIFPSLRRGRETRLDTRLRLSRISQRGDQQNLDFVAVPPVTPLVPSASGTSRHRRRLPPLRCVRRHHTHSVLLESDLGQLYHELRILSANLSISPARLGRARTGTTRTLQQAQRPRHHSTIVAPCNVRQSELQTGTTVTTFPVPQIYTTSSETSASINNSSTMQSATI